MPTIYVLSRNKKNNVYPCKPNFTILKWGLRGSKLYRHVFVMDFQISEQTLNLSTGSGIIKEVYVNVQKKKKKKRMCIVI